MGYPEYQRLFFFSRVWREKRAGQYEDFKDTDNRTEEVSGAQGIVGLNHSQLESHFEQRDFKFRGTL